MKTFDTVIWDFNGTLLNDVALCLEAINAVLEKRQLPLLNLESYREQFTFPVLDFYKAIGFDFSKEAFEIPAHEYINYFHARAHRVKLFPEIPQLLAHIQNKGYRQMVLSAMKEDHLLHMLKDLNIENYFQYIAGIDDHLAQGKEERGKKLLADTGLHPAKAIFIGDTLHDAEVAQTLGIKPILLAQGHFSGKRLRTNGYTVYENLNDLHRIFCM